MPRGGWSVLLGLLACSASTVQAQVSLGSASVPMTIQFISTPGATTYTFGAGLVQQTGTTVQNLNLSTVQFDGLGGTLRYSSPLGTVVVAKGVLTQAAADTLRFTGNLTCGTGSISGGGVRAEGSSGDQFLSACALPALRVRKATGDLVLTGDVVLSDSLHVNQGAVRLGGRTLSLQTDLAGTVTGGAVRFYGTRSQLVQPPARTLTGLVVDKTGGTTALAAPVTLSDSLVVRTSDLNLNGQLVDLGTTAFLRERGGRVFGTTGTLRAQATLNAPDGANPGNLGMEFTSSEDFGLTTVVRGHTVQTGAGAQSVARYFDVTTERGSGLDAFVMFYYNDAELGSLTESRLKLYRSTNGGTSWTYRGGVVSRANNRLMLSGIDAFSRWTAAESGALPVSLVGFEARSDGDAVRLAWRTEGEQNNVGWGIEAVPLDCTVRRGGTCVPLLSTSRDPAWQEVGFVQGAGTSSQAQSYTYRADRLTPGAYAFRLRQVDLDGAVSYSEELEATLTLGAAFRLIEPAPNPLRTQARFAVAVQEAQTVRAEVFDALGRRVAVLADEGFNAGQSRTLTFDASALAEGVYVLRIQGERFSTTRTLVVAR